jgi:CheY-like chemotaxis protein
MTADLHLVCRRVYSVDDEPYTVHIWYQLEDDDAFSGVAFEGAADMDAVVKDVEITSIPTLYVLDSRMPVSSDVMKRFRSLILERTNIDIDELVNVLEVTDQHVLAGVFASAWIRMRRPDCRVLLLTAFASTLLRAKKNRAFASILAIGADKILPKPCSEADIRQVVREHLSLN